jgi:phosphate transport system permease protein
MMTIYLIVLATLLILGFFAGRSRASGISAGRLAELHSLPVYHGLFVAMGIFTPMAALYLIGVPALYHFAESGALSYFPASVVGDDLQRSVAVRDITRLAAGQFSGEPTQALRDAGAYYANVKSLGQSVVIIGGTVLGVIAGVLSYWQITLPFRARHHVERFFRLILIVCAVVAVLTTIGIVFSLVFETYRFFFDPALKGKPTIAGFLFGLDWNPQAAMRADQGELSTAYGFVPLLVGSLLITFIAICVAGPLGLFSAIYLAEYASPRVRAYAKPVLEILAGIPTVVLGFFAALTVAPLIRGWGEAYGLDIASESALAAGLVMGMMIIPFISSLSDDVINAVPQSMRDGAYALGATKSETIKQVILPAALPGIVSAFMLAISRAIGETMIVVMAAGLAANLTFNPLEAVTTITVQIKTILVGDQEFDSAKTLSAFALGLVLFFVTLLLNFIALRVSQKYREQYD